MSAAGVPEAQFKWWEDLYCNRLADLPAREPGELEPPRAYPTNPSKITESNWQEHIQGTRIAFPVYRDFFDARISELGLHATLRRYLPSLLPGLAGSALHALIHTGWGVEASSGDLTAEGLAYMATSFQPLATGTRHNPPDRLWSPDAAGPAEASLAFLSNAREQDLSRVALEASETGAYLRLGRGGFQHRIIAFDDPAFPLGAALNSFGSLGLPPITESLAGATEEAAAVAAAALLGSDNEFFVIHGLTSLHAVLVLAAHLDPEQQRLAISYWWRAVMATIVAQDFPGFSATVKALNDWRDSRSRETESTSTITTSQREWWLNSLREALQSLDEHTPKAVYVLWRWAEWQSFPPTTVALFMEATKNVIKPHSSGQLHQNLWFDRSFSNKSKKRER